MNWKLIRIIDSWIGIPLIRLIALFRRHETTPPHHSPRRILLIKFWGIGNIFMLLPSIHALKRSFPAARIDFLTLEGNICALESFDLVDSVITISTSNPLAFVSSWVKAHATIRSARYDLVIDFEQFARFSVLIAALARVPRSVGFSTKNQRRHYLFTDPVEYDNTIHITRSFFTLIRKTDPQAVMPNGNHILHDSDLRRRGGEILQSLGIDMDTPVVIMHVGTSDNFAERRWDPKHHAELARRLRDLHGFTILLTGLAEERKLIDRVTALLDSTDRIHNLGGDLPFADYFALISISDLVVSADTAAVHIASALRVPVVGIYGPNTPLLYGPWQENGTSVYERFECSPCITNFNGKINVCRHPAGKGACMAAISVDSVYRIIHDRYLRAGAPFRIMKIGKKLP